MSREARWGGIILFLAAVSCLFFLSAAEAGTGDFVRKWGAPQHYKDPTGVTTDKSGKVYVSDLDRIQVFGPDGKLIRRWGSYGSGNGQLSYPRGLAVYSTGEIYVVDSGNFRIQVFDSQGKFLRKWGSFGTGNGQFENPVGIALDASGNVLVADYGHYDNGVDSWAGRVQVFDRNGNFLRNFGSYGSGPTQIQAPSAVTVDKNSNIYVADSKPMNRIQVFNSAGTFIRSIAVDDGYYWLNNLAVDGNGTVYVSHGDKDGYYSLVSAYDSSGNFLKDVRLPEVPRWEEWYWNPYAIAVNANNDLFLADEGNEDLEALDSAGNRLPQWWTYGTGDGQFNSPLGIAVDSTGNVHETDFGHAPSMVYSNRVQIFDAAGTFLRSWPGNDPGNRDPTALAVDKSGNTYLLLAEPLVYYGQEPAVQVYDSTGKLLRSWGSKGSGNGQFSHPRGIAVAASGDVYVTDGDNNRVVVFDSGGTFIRAWGSEGSGSGQFRVPSGIAVAKNGNVYVADSGNYRIQVFDSAGNFLFKWGYQGPGKGRFAYVTGLAFDDYGHLYVLDAGNNLVQVFDRNINFLLQWGRQGDDDGAFDFYVNGIAPDFTSARPYGLAVNAAGTAVYVADYENNRIQEFEGYGSGPLPLPWATRDIGNVGVPGQVMFANSTFTLGGSGANIWGTVDAFRYVYQPLIGDGQIVALLGSIDNTNGYAKGGVMIRESLSPDSRHAMVDLTPGYGIEFSRRLTTAGPTSVNATPGITPSEWVKLVRQGNTFSAFISKNGVTWTSIGSATISMASSVYVGLIVNSHLNSVLCWTSIGRVAVTAQKHGPTVTITAPADAASFSAPGSIGLSATASPGTGAAVKQVEYYAGSTLIGSASAAPYTVTWSNVPAGSYALTAKVTDSLGQTATSPAVSITVSASALPTPWLSQDVGSVGVVGSAAYANGSFTLKGSGSDIWSSSDAFRFIYQPMTGDAQIIARVATMQNTNAYAKAGVMIRNSLAANAIHATMDLTPTSGAEFLRRTSTGGITNATLKSGLAAPYWVKLVRSGNVFTGSVSSDGVTWTAVGSSTISMGSTVYVGLIVNSHNNAVLCNATADHVTAATLGSDTVAPTVTALTLPATWNSLTVPITTLTASDNFGVAGYLVTESSTKPSATASGWSNTPPGSYTFAGTGSKTLYAWAKDAAGNVSAGRPATVTVSAGALPAPWQSRDIGSVGVAGSATYSNGVFTLNGSGANIYGTVDAFRYVYQPITGNGVIIARVSYLQNTNSYAKGGVMFRSTLAADSSYAMVALTPSGAEFSVRGITGGDGTGGPSPGVTVPSWVKITRVGNSFTGSVSSDGVTWVDLGTKSADMPATVYVGLIVNSRNNTVLCTTTMDHVSLSTAMDAIAPTVTAFSVPASSTSLTVPITTFTATDNVAVTGYKVTESATKPNDPVWSSTAPTSYTFGSAGTKTLYAWARDGASNISQSRSATTTVSGLPAGWQKRDVGSVGIPGSASYANGIYTLTGSGANIWGTADSFYFVYKTMTGDGEIRGNVASLPCANTWAKGGVMMRQSLTADSIHAMMDITPSAGAEFSRRLTTGGSTTVSSTAGIKVPYAVRLVRKGTSFTGYISFDRFNWVQVGSATINMSDTIYVGFIVNSHNNSALCTTTIDGQ
jgi:sugar lactone lactonase YvrE/regulation of enolase protein 1 (concanavalin A-like superfamily)